MNLEPIPILDHHCHTIRRPGAPLWGDEFRRFFAETTDPRMPQHIRHTVFYKRILRDLAALFARLPADLTVSIEVPSASRAPVLGDRVWALQAKAAKA